MAINSDSRWDAGIGLTEASQATECYIKAMRSEDECHYYQHCSYYKDTVSVIILCLYAQARSDTNVEQNATVTSRCDKITRQLQDAQHFRPIYPGLTLSPTTTTIIATNKTCLMQPENAAHKALSFLEAEINKHGLVPPPPASSQSGWLWDDARKDYYYWNNEGYFTYSKGDMVHADGTVVGQSARVVARIRDRGEAEDNEEDNKRQSQELVLTHRKY
jgi:hypothetical protein